MVKIDQGEELRRIQMAVSLRGAAGQIKERALLRSLLKGGFSESILGGLAEAQRERS